MFVLNPQSGTPIYRQLYEQVSRLVASGRLEPGEALPSVRDLAREHAVNPMTISKAYSLLEGEGILERHRGKPMTVAKSRKTQSRKADELAGLQSQIDELVLAAGQLQLGKSQVLELLKERWEKKIG